MAAIFSHFFTDFRLWKVGSIPTQASSQPGRSRRR
jgi:hypothetical protein